MLSLLLRKAGLKVVARNLQQYEPIDPVYETYMDESGRQRKRKRELPPGLSSRDQTILRKVNQRAHRLDRGFDVCGMRFGWTFWLGLIPFIGGIADALLAYMLVIRKAREANIPNWLLGSMLLNTAISAALGLIPFVGGVAIATYKANSRNAALLEEFLAIRGSENLMVIDEQSPSAAEAEVLQLNLNRALERRMGRQRADLDSTSMVVDGDAFAD